MRKHVAWLGAAALAVAAMVTPAHAGDPLKPFVVLVLDTSGSMSQATGSGPPSCGGSDTKLDHARCAIRKIVNSYGDMVFALGRFRMSMSGTTTPNTFPAGCTSNGAGTPGGSTCNATSDMFELLTPLVDGNNDAADAWVNLTGNTCTATGTDPEIWRAAGNTPLAGSLNGTKLYWLGTQNTSPSNFLIWPSNQAGFAPIANDPTNTSFLPKPGKPATCNPDPATCDATAGCSSSTDCCCLEQCRPYITILLTDGDETCVAFDPNTTNAATSLLSTDVNNRRYRVQTRPIGFGKDPGDPEIEGIAHAGGTPDDFNPATFEGSYASDEASLQLAISSILDDAIRTEVCNGLDDDCDTNIDEDFPNKGNACTNGKLGVCARSGNLVCKADGTGLRCDAVSVTCNTATNRLIDGNGNDLGPCLETCNNIDDDCDGKIDEGLVGCTCSPQAEQCDGVDNDCDGRIDEASTNGPPLSRPCGTGTCQGVEVCDFAQFGGFGGCTAATPTAEVCNGLDDNCDGLRDGFQQSCSDIPGGFPGDDGRNNPGDPGHIPAPIPENICHAGTKLCPANVGPPNSFSACQFEVKPCVGACDLCNGLDDDCDNSIDEDFVPADCSSNCGIGQTVCTNGVLSCTTVTAPDDDTCDGVDDDCDGLIDEDFVCDDPPGCACTDAFVCNGVQSCVNGHKVCQGQPISQESCDCQDNNCNGQVDEGNLCAPGSSCTQFCQCAFPCANGEFPCPLGKFCKQDDDGNRFCIADPCFNMACPPVNGVKQVCQVSANGDQGSCVDACSVINCAPLICIPETGECKPDDCTTFPERCDASQNCIAGVCVTNLCKDVTCPADQYCSSGNCVASCAGVDCPSGERCRLGVCETDPCHHPCPFGQACNDATGECVDDSCPTQNCPQGQWCNPNNNGGTCEDDPCVGTACPSPDQICRGGTCFDPNDFLPDAGIEDKVTAGGGGCNTGGDAGGFGLLLGLGALLMRRRSRRDAGGAA